MQTTQTLAQGKAGYAQWRDDIRNICGRFDATAPGNLDGFFGRIASHNLIDLEFAEVSTNAASLRKSPGDVRAEDARYYFLIYQHSGSAVLAQRGREAVLHPGDTALIDSRCESEFRYLGGMRHVSLHLPCDELDRRLKGARARVCETLGGAEPLGGILGQFIRQISAKHALFDVHEGGAMKDALLALIAPLAEDRESVGGSLRDYARVVSHVDAHLMDELSPEGIGRALGLSVRSLYRLFEERDKSLNETIREARLRRCVEQLRAASHSHESLTAIAFRWGFKDSAHFSRSFRLRFGMTPRDYRRLG